LTLGINLSMQTLYVNAMFETVTPEQTTQFQTLCPESRASWAVVQPPYDTCERAYKNRDGKLFTAGPHAGSGLRVVLRDRLGQCLVGLKREQEIGSLRDLGLVCLTGGLVRRIRHRWSWRSGTRR
jgi:hypothetical protein